MTLAGSAIYKFIPGPGTHSYKAVFLGTNTYAGSSSSAEPLVVVAASGPVKPTVGIQASGTQGDYALLGTVATTGAASPSGQISFLDTTNANYVLGSATLGATGSNGISFRTSYSFPLTASDDSLGVADFNGDGIPDLLLWEYSLGHCCPVRSGID